MNLLSISQICDQDFMVLFSKGKCLVMDESGKKLISGVRTLDNCYGLVPDVDIVCNSIRLPNKDLWHQWMGHASYKYLSIVSKHESVLGIPKLSRMSNGVCGPCQLGKQMKAKHPGIQTSATSRPLKLLRLDLMGPTRTESLGGKRYIVVVVNDFTSYTWVILLRSKSDASEHIETLCTRLHNEKSLKIDRILSDHGKEFKNSYMESFCAKSSISQEFSAPITPQQNGVVERKNRVIQEMARAMLHNKDVARNLWREAVNIACHTVNRVYFRPGTKKTPYELWKGRKPNVKYFRIFGSTCFILKDRENVGKFHSRSDEGKFLGCSSTSKAYRVYNKRTMKVMETVNVVIDESLDSSSKKGIEELPKEILPPEPKEVQEIIEQEPASPSTPDTPSVLEDSVDIPTSPDFESHEEKGPSFRIKLNHPIEVIVGNMNELKLRKRTVDKCVTNFVSYSCYLSQVEPTKVEKAL